MDRQRDRALDLSGMLAVVASALTVALVIAAAVTDRAMLLAAAAIAALVAVLMVIVRRSADGRPTPPADGPDAADENSPTATAGWQDGDRDGPYRIDAIAARADLLATLRHGFSAGRDHGPDTPPADQPADRTAPSKADEDSTSDGVVPTELKGSNRGVDSGPLLDPVTGLFTHEFFVASLPKRVSAARRGLRPLSVAAVTVVEGRPVDTAPAADPTVVAEAMIEAFREADTIAITNDGLFLVLLEDTPEAGAVWTLERLRRHLNERHADHTMWAGVSCYPAYSFEADGLIRQARAALSDARQWQQDRIEIAVGSPD